MTESTVSAPDSSQRLKVNGLILILALLAVAVPAGLVAMAGRSSASFSDAEVLDDNFLGAATVDIEIGQQATGFVAENMVPGDSVTGQVEVTNVGSLPIVLGIEAGRSEGALGDWLLFDLGVSSAACVAEDTQQDPVLSGLALATTNTNLIDPLVNVVPELQLAPGQTVNVCLRATLPLSTPNAAQGTRADIELVINALHDIEEG
ncbi:MAG: hypothetical protein GY773_18465 [Actinomycetia bacterium]|nr:hypothetical protein [Actinomycetes bacterium]